MGKARLLTKSRILALASLMVISTVAIVAWAHSLHVYGPRDPGKLTITAVTGGVTISSQTPAKYDARLVCDLGYRVRKLGGKLFPTNQRIVREVVPVSPIPLSKSSEFYTACRGGHAAVLTASHGFYAKCKEVKVTWGVASEPFVSQMWAQYDLTCENVPPVYPLKRALRLYWSGPRADNFTAATDKGYYAAAYSKYRYVRIEGQLRTESAPGLVPMKLYWHSGRNDNMSVVTAKDEHDAKAAGYRYVRVQGYLYPANVSPVPKGTLPLHLYWHEGRKDNISVAHPDTLKSVGDGSGYIRAGLQGYIFKVPKASDLNANGGYNQ